MQKKKRIFRGIFITVICICVVTSIEIIVYSKNMTEKINSEVVSSLMELSNQGKEVINREIEGQISKLRNAAMLIAEEDGQFSKSTMNKLKDMIKENGYVGIGIAYEDGILHTTDGEEIDISNKEYYIEPMNGKSVVSDIVIDRYAGSKKNIYSVPIYFDNAVKGVLCASNSIEAFRSAIEITSFQGRGYSYVIKSNGNSVVDSAHPTSFADFQNIEKSLLEADDYNVECAEVLKEKLKNGEEGYIIFKNKVFKHMYFKPLDINDWYLLQVVPSDVVNEKLQGIMIGTYILCAISIISFIIAISYVIFAVRKNRIQMEKIAYYDEITNGYNYAKFKLEVLRILEKKLIKSYAVISIDVDKFRYINDVFGYKEGNNAIVSIWNEITEDTNEDFIAAHKGADYFLILCGYLNRQELITRLDKICEKVKSLKGRNKFNYELVLSIGVYEIWEDEYDIDRFVDFADIARKTAKGYHSSIYKFYDDNIRKQLYKEKQIEDVMEQALKDKEFKVYYQPKYEPETEKIVGAEALVRWQKNDGEIIYPGDFIPLFEKNGFITEIDKYVLEKTCSDLKEWQNEGINIVPVSVNVSRVHLHNDNFVEEYIEIVDKAGISSEYIRLELTETALFNNENILKDTIDKLHESGFRILMDDFGTGYSSLNMLKNIPIDILKLDKSFSDDICDERGKTMVISIIELAQSLNLQVIAEGVESKEQVEILKNAKCDAIQGYYYAKPMKREDFKNMLI